MGEQLSNSYLDDYLSEHDYNDYSSIVFIRNSEIIYQKHKEGINLDTKQDISFLIPAIISLLTGIALDRHYLKSVEVPIRTILPEFDIGRDHLHRVIKIKHLLSMSSGLLWSSSMHWLRPIYYDLIHEENTSYVLSDILVADVPGMHYCYKEWDYILLSVTLEKVLDVSLDEFCKEALFKPLGIELSEQDFYLSSKSIITNMLQHQNNFTCSSKDVCKLSQMLLENGIYQNKKILSKGYMRDMLEPQKTNPDFGYLWTLYPFGYGIIGKCNQGLILNPGYKISYILLLQNKQEKVEYCGIFAKLMEHVLTTE